MTVISAKDVSLTFLLAAVSYLTAALVAAAIYHVARGYALDVERIVITAEFTLLLSLVPFLLAKAVMALVQQDGPVIHAVCGACVAVVSVAVVMKLPDWSPLLVACGAIAGATYWVVRGALRRVVPGVPA